MSMYQLGVVAASETINTRRSLVPLVGAAFDARNVDLVTGLGAVLLSVLDACQAAGKSLQVGSAAAKALVDATPSSRRLLFVAHTSRWDDAAGELLREIAGAIDAFQRGEG